MWLKTERNKTINEDEEQVTQREFVWEKNAKLGLWIGVWFVLGAVYYYWYKVAFKLALRPLGKKPEWYTDNNNKCFIK